MDAIGEAILSPHRCTTRRHDMPVEQPACASEVRSGSTSVGSTVARVRDLLLGVREWPLHPRRSRGPGWNYECPASWGRRMRLRRACDAADQGPACSVPRSAVTPPAVRWS